jgi:2-keto-4-pentenoate hydratase/2-oxohepta-3-ene-1,7-dioic acid hydratase in catechol pathway
MEGLKPLDFPRFLNNPNSSLAASPAEVEIPKRATGFDVGIELAFVIKKIASAIKQTDAEAYILGYVPMVTLWDDSFREEVERPQGQEEKLIHAMYCRWGDGFNVISDHPFPLADAGSRDLDMRVAVDGIGDIHANSGNYLAFAGECLEFITRHITLSPGDVVTLGRVGKMIHIPQDNVEDRMLITGSIDGLGDVSATLTRPGTRG